MTAARLLERLRELSQENLPLPAAGATAVRHRRLMETGREDLSLAKLAEAHWDAVAILAEAGRSPAPGALYAVWASEMPGHALSLEVSAQSGHIRGSKMFASGAGLVDRALVTVGAPRPCLVDVDLRANNGAIEIDGTAWKTDAFRLTQTSTLTFHGAKVALDAVIGQGSWYVDRLGFWHGACGPAACWAGGVAGLLDYAMRSPRHDAHTLAHLGAMHANVWGMLACLEKSGDEMDRCPADRAAAHIRALAVRHLVEQACTDTLRRFARAYGPFPLSMDEEVSRRYQEADLYLRQSHGERDLSSLGASVQAIENMAHG